MASEWDCASSHARGVMRALMVGASVCACVNSPITTKYETTTDLKSAAPVTRLVVFGIPQSPGFGEAMNRGFELGLRSRLAVCRVALSIMHTDALDLDAEAHLAIEIATFRASSTLSIMADGGAIHRDTYASTLWFKLKLADVGSSRVAWTAAATFEVTVNGLSNDQSSGARFATSIVSQLRDDGVLTHCPPPSVPWPKLRWPDKVEPDPVLDCRVARRNFLFEAKQIEDKDERREKLKALPTCK